MSVEIHDQIILYVTIKYKPDLFRSTNERVAVWTHWHVMESLRLPPFELLAINDLSRLLIRRFLPGRVVGLVGHWGRTVRWGQWGTVAQD